MLEHGGRLLRAARAYGIPVGDWLDLSTGISPFAWPVPAIPPEVWHRLPEEEDGLVEAARHYYHTRALLPVAGAQAAIQTLPRLRARSRVGVISPGYAEHAHAWRQAGHRVAIRPAVELIATAREYDVIVLIHPNNPGGDHFAPSALRALHASLAGRGGWLVVDEAFMDATPENSLCAYAGGEGLVVLRSVGKFFGMAGARAGFVSAWPGLLDRLRGRLGPWPLSGPTRYVVRKALADTAWHRQARARLHAAGARLKNLLTGHGLTPAAGTAFFQWCCDARACWLQDALARHGILARRFDNPASLRFGLPGTKADCARLDAVLAEITS